MAKYARYRSVRGVGIITLTRPPLNALSRTMCEVISGLIERAVADDDCQAILIRVRHSDFAIGLPMNAKAVMALRALTEQIENTTKPVVIALRGVVRGGAFELALACHYRVMQETGGAVLLRDVEIGLPPAAGGIQRLVRWAGVNIALRMAISSQAFGARPALGAGIVDDTCVDEVNDYAVEFASKLTPDDIRPAGTFRRKNIDFAADHALIQQIKARYKGHAETQIIDSIEAASLLPYEAGLLRDYDAHEACFDKPESIAMASFARGAATLPDDPKTTALVAGRLRDAVIRAGDIAVALGARPDAVDKVTHKMGFVRGVYDTLSDEARAQIEEALEARAAKPTPLATIELRIVAALANEVLRLMDEGAIASPSEADVLLVRAREYDRRHLGPMYRANATGPMALRAELVRNARLGELAFWTPHPMWDVLIRDDRPFADIKAPKQD